MGIARRRWLALASLVALGACAPRPEAASGAKVSVVADDKHPGKAVYTQYCSTCHDDSEKSGAPSLEAIRTLNRATVDYTLKLGYMQLQAKAVPPEELKQLIEWLPRDAERNDDWVKGAQCSIKLRKVRLDAGQKRYAVRFGIDLGNNRRQGREDVGLTTADMGNLELAWAIAFPQTPTMRSQPVVVGDTVFIAATDAARVYALDAGTGCVKWMHAADSTLRSSLAFAEGAADRPAMILLGDASGKVQALNAETGALQWVTDVKLNWLNRITGAPMVEGDTVYAPVSVIESNFPPDDTYECCKGRGAIVAMDLKTGKKKWVGPTIDEEAKPTRIGRSGTQQYGPAGAMVWSTPVVDAKRRLLYVGTGESLSWPASDNSDAIIAYDMASGAKKWVFQATKNDIWNSACGRRGANCDWPGEYWSPDFDFGATSMLVKRDDGSEIVVAGQKSGVVWALNPDTGALVWSNKVGRGSAQGGVHWGMASDGKRVFVPLNDAPIPAGGVLSVSLPGQPAPPPVNPNWGPGIHALDAKSGEVQWTYKPTAADCGNEVAAGKTSTPDPQWRIQTVTAPMLPPPPRITTTRPAAPRPAAVAARPSPTPSAAPSPAASASPVAAATPGASPSAAASASPEATPSAPPRPATGEGGTRVRCRYGMSPAPLLVDGALVTGNIAGMLRIFDAETGKVLFEYQTNRAFPKTVNGLPGHGGALDSAPYVAGGGTLFVQSGYARFGEPPGNMLLAFRPQRK